LACETDTARIVMEKGGKHAWEVRHGAFDDADFTNLPETHWTLLVNDTDQHLAELKAVMEPFRFIPDWRIDDLMISFAVEGGSVGPHVDEYDVFLIQAQGQRRWQITTQPAKPDNFLAGLDLRIMRDFEAEQEWVVNPGDMLYLPPNVPHYGVALNECMTYSVGFRAPSQAEMLENLVENLLEDPRLKQRFNDSERECQAHPGELTAGDMERLIDFVVDALPQDTQALQLWLGKYLSQPKVDNNDTLEPSCLSKAELIKLINRRATFEKPPGIRFLYFINDDEICLFANGTLHRAAAEQLQFIQYLCNTTIFKHNSYKTHLQDKNALELWRDLLEVGLIKINN
jgi:50S ribosomal protein L16 3-hydroxylase